MDIDEVKEIILGVAKTKDIDIEMFNGIVSRQIRCGRAIDKQNINRENIEKLADDIIDTVRARNGNRPVAMVENRGDNLEITLFFNESK